MSEVVATTRTILVVGGGISGMTAALEAAEAGADVLLLEKGASLGGWVSQLSRGHPTLCPPARTLEDELRRLGAGRLRVLTRAEVVRIDGQPGDYTATVRLAPPAPREVGNADRSGDPDASPDADPDAVPNPDTGERKLRVKAGAVVWATGWRPYDAAKIEPYGYGRIPDVVSSLDFARLADPLGPTGGRLLRPSDGREARRVAFVLCAGSRDKNHLRHCSRVCCAAALEQAAHVTGHLGDEADVTLYYVDIRVTGSLEDLYRKVRSDPRVKFVRSKVAQITRDAHTGSPVLHGVATEGGQRYARVHDLVVLAVGMEPGVPGDALPLRLVTHAGGFVAPDPANGAIFAAGCAAEPLDVSRCVQHATVAALRALQVVRRVGGVEG
jgi:quinone-modifying oxidoreductase subunit QmoA